MPALVRVSASITSPAFTRNATQYVIRGSHLLACGPLTPCIGRLAIRTAALSRPARRMGFLVATPAPRLGVLQGVAMPAFTEARRRRYQAARRKNGRGAVEVSTTGRPHSAGNNSPSRITHL